MPRAYHFMVLVAGLACPQLVAASPPAVSAPTAQQPKVADFQGEVASRDTTRVADWVVATGDNGERPFVIIDKINARVYLFDMHAQLRGAAAALLGLGLGDDGVSGIGQRKLSTISPKERTTPAGRFIASLGNDYTQDILWVDYDLALSLHRVITGNVKDRRHQRLATSTPLDNRISYGCINVPVDFYDKLVMPAFNGTTGVVYILPETKMIEEVFAMGISQRRSSQKILFQPPHRSSHQSIAMADSDQIRTPAGKRLVSNYGHISVFSAGVRASSMSTLK